MFVEPLILPKEQLVAKKPKRAAKKRVATTKRPAKRARAKSASR